MKRWHEEQGLMERRLSKVTHWPAQKLQEGPGRMRKHRPLEGCGCRMCQWEKWQKGTVKRKQREWEHEHMAEGDEVWPR